MNIDFFDKVVVVTGAGRGLGFAVAEAFAASGATAVICDIQGQEAAAEKIRNTGGKAVAMHLDVSDRGEAKARCAEIAQKFGRIDVWVNNAGINVGPEDRKKIYEFSDQWWDSIFRVDLNGVFNCSKAAIEYLRNTGGNIVNIASVTGMIPLRKQCAFVAAKGGVIKLSQAMAIELADEGIRVNVVSPGSIGIAATNKLWTDDAARDGLLAHIPQHRQGEPADVAGAVLFLASEQANYITGAVLKVDGGWSCGFSRDF